MTASRILITLLVAIVAWANVPAATAQEAEDEWGSILAIYIWPSIVEGENAAGDVVVPVNVGPDDVGLSPGFHLEFFKKKWMFGVDLLWNNTVEDGIVIQDGSNPVNVSGGYNSTWIQGELLLGWRPVALDGGGGLDVLAGARILRQSLDVNLAFTYDLGSRQTTDSLLTTKETWVDPFIGLRWTYNPENTWWFGARADVGGFDVGSKLAYNIAIFGNWRVSDVVDLSLGYKYLDIDYENDKTGDDFYAHKAVHAGLIFGAIFRLQ